MSIQKTILSLFLNILHKTVDNFLCRMTVKMSDFSICYKTVTIQIFRQNAQNVEDFLL